MLPVNIKCSKTKNSALVTEYGQLVTAPISYSTPHYVDVAVLNTTYEIVEGKTGKQFVITSLLIASDKDFGSSVDAETITIYESAAEDISTSLGIIFQVDLLRNDRLVATGLNLITSKGRSLVGIATSAAVDVTIAGYYIPV